MRFSRTESGWERGNLARGASPACANVVQRIWSSPDSIMLVFAGSAAEFAVNKAVDWLFWTNALPEAPIERFFETVRFAQAMVFGGPDQLAAAVAAVNRAHAGVERSRRGHIPQWAYRDVLFMLIDYGERAHSVVFGPMSEAERLTYWNASIEIGRGLHIEDLPCSYEEYQAQRRVHLLADNERSDLTDRLYASYRKQLGPWRMRALLDLQASIVPHEVARLLPLKRKRRVDLLLRGYRYLPRRALLRLLGPVLLPSPYGRQLLSLTATSVGVTALP